MRPVLHGDVTSAARVLLGTPEAQRRWMCRQMIGEAVLAERHRLRTGRMHPRWGNGSLMAAARRRVLADEPTFDDPDYCGCVETVLQCLIEHAVSQVRR
ncbi:hypothetical protein [Thalassococcus sp. S3]|uniref:DUF7742 family protein n=1 Tax=Thalassococcus sp. S3 TaxID=2017482 RepID=UPI0010246CD6|nr:hypothetical protein [Thalassococcus sp. S3]QBF32262.1 hypothetical protein CFI11_13675 [Thalassococcus sp. S3]